MAAWSDASVTWADTGYTWLGVSLEPVEETPDPTPTRLTVHSPLTRLTLRAAHLAIHSPRLLRV